MAFSTRPALATRTNTLHAFGLPQGKLTSFLSTSPPDKIPKRRRDAEDKQPLSKRFRVAEPSESESEETEGEFEDADDEDAFMEDPLVAHARARMSMPFNVMTRQFTSTSIHPRKHAPSTLPILQSFVSSNKSDIFKCQSVDDDTYMTPPYACSYSHNSKRGGTPPHLAVATEQGTVHILETSKRNDWDVEPQRSTFQPHNNGIFDVKWSTDDAFLATCSGDQSVRVSDVKTGSITHVLRGHSSTVKCMAWNPTHSSLVATGGRDGSICLWDLRVSDRQRSGDTEVMVVAPCVTIYGAHEDIKPKSKPRVKKGKQISAPRTITNLLYPDCDPYGLVSSGSFDGILRYWDLRQPVTPRKSKTAKPSPPIELYSSSLDPTMLGGSRRPRGIISLASGTGPSAGLVFAIGANSQIHIYDLPTLTPLRSTLQHEKLQTNSFYVGLSVSPCGRWVACGGSGTQGNSFLFDVENTCRPFAPPACKGVELMGRIGEVGAIDWAHNMLATCTDDGTVRIWRPDVTRQRWCQSRLEESSNWSWAV